MASTPCCPTDVKPVVNNYKGSGKYVTLSNGLKMYVSAGSSGSNHHAMMNIYDIFGHSGYTEQFADRLADLGFVVCVPGFIRDGGWPPENIPPKKDGGKFPPGVEPADGTDVLMQWIMGLETDEAESIQLVKDYLVSEYKITKFGAVGMCWGAKVAWKAAAKGLLDAVAGCHASFLDKKDAELCVETNTPQCLLNSKDEPERYTTELKPIVLGQEGNVFKDFPTVHHGWMGTRGIGALTDFDNDEIASKYKEALTDLANFFKKAFA